MVLGGLTGGAASVGNKLTAAVTSGRISALFTALQRLVMTPLLQGGQTGSINFIKTSKVNPFELIPTHGLTLGRNKYNGLKAYIKATGKLPGDTIKVVIHNGKKYIVDGHHRARAAKELGWLEVEIEEVSLPYLGYKTLADLNIFD